MKEYFTTSVSLSKEVHDKIKDLPRGVRSELVNEFFGRLNLKDIKVTITKSVDWNGIFGDNTRTAKAADESTETPRVRSKNGSIESATKSIGVIYPAPLIKSGQQRENV